MLSARTAALFDEYASSHRHPTNRLTHKIAIPLIVLHIVAMLDWVQLAPIFALPGGWLTLGEVALIPAAVWYLRADLKLGVLVLVGMVACLPVGRMLPWWAVVAVAVGAWVIQLAGHVVWEKKQPSFLTNMVHALVGPLFIAALLTGAYRAEPRPAATGLAG